MNRELPPTNRYKSANQNAYVVLYVSLKPLLKNKMKYSSCYVQIIFSLSANLHVESPMLPRSSIVSLETKSVLTVVEADQNGPGTRTYI